MARRTQVRTEQMKTAETAMPIPHADPTRWVVGMFAGYLLLVVAGAIWLQPAGRMAAANPANWNEAIFASVNAATLTGFERSLPPERYASPAAQFILMGLTLAGTLLSLIAGGMLVARIASLPVNDGEIVAGSAVLTVLATLLGAVAAGGDGGIADVLMLALSAFSNSGLHLAPLPSLDSPRTLLVLLPLSLIGGLGVPVLLEIRNRIRGRQNRLSDFSWLVLSSTAVLYIVGLLAFVVFMGDRSAGESSVFGASSVAAVNVRGAGFSLDPLQWPRPVQWAAMPLMVIGWNPGGTGGGLKVTSLIAAWSLAVALIRGRQPSRAGGFAVAWIGLYAAVVLAAVILQLNAEASLDGERALFETISAASNVGLSPHRVGGAQRDLILSAVMLFGRIAPVAMLLWMWRQDARGLPVA